MTEHQIFWADDHIDILLPSMRMFVEQQGHQIVGTAKSVAEVREFVTTDTEVSLGIFDGKMPNRGDGERAAGIFREHRPDAKVASYSNDPHNTWGDYNWNKDMPLTYFLEAIDQA
jgi:hypothetical protein